MFAGYGGTGNLAMETLKMILKDPAKYTALFRKDKKAFMLEAARVYPPVGGMNAFAYRKELTFHFQGHDGKPLRKPKTVVPGDVGIIFTSTANQDPLIFADPGSFIPGRANADKLLSWNNEVGEFGKCKTVAGCPEAPRGCPGTFLSYRIATRAVEFFVDGIEEASGFE